MKRFLLLALLVGLVACTSEPTTDTTTADYDSFGETISAENAQSLSTILAQTDQYVNQTVSVRGTVQQVCQNKGCWMTLEGTDSGQSVRVTFKDYGFFVPKDIAEQTVVLRGVVAHDTLSVDVQKHYAEDAGASEAELAAITEPLPTVAIVADGVLVQKPTAAPSE